MHKVPDLYRPPLASIEYKPAEDTAVEQYTDTLAAKGEHHCLLLYAAIIERAQPTEPLKSPDTGLVTPLMCCMGFLAPSPASNDRFIKAYAHQAFDMRRVLCFIVDLFLKRSNHHGSRHASPVFPGRTSYLDTYR